MAARGEDASMIAVGGRQKPQRLGSGLGANCLDRRREAVRMDWLGIACEVRRWTWMGARDWKTGASLGDYLSGRWLSKRYAAARETGGQIGVKSAAGAW